MIMMLNKLSVDDWQSTLHRIPKTVDIMVAERGGNRLCELGVADAADADMFTNFDSWTESLFWPAITSLMGLKMSRNGRKSALKAEVSSGKRASSLGLRLQEGIVMGNELLTAQGAPEKRMIRFKLPPGTTYNCGDYLAVLPINPASVVRRAMRYFNLPCDATLTLTSNGASSSIPLSTPISAFEFFSTYFELSQPASRRDLNTLAEAATDASTQSSLKDLMSNPTRFAEEITGPRTSLLDILTNRHPSSIILPLEEFLLMLPPMRVRQYSVSSSPLPNPTECTITFSVVTSTHSSDEIATTSTRGKKHRGVSSNYLSKLQPGDRSQISIRPCHSSFRPPPNLRTPLIMICAGSGLAPFRGFIMDRVEKLKNMPQQHQQPQAPPPSPQKKQQSHFINPASPNNGNSLDISDSASEYSIPITRDKNNQKKGQGPARAILYIGCRTKTKDDIHSADLENWARLGAVDVRWAYSRPDHADPQTQTHTQGLGPRHVQDLILQDKNEIWEMMQGMEAETEEDEERARIYVCGGMAVANGVRSIFKKIYLEKRREEEGMIRMIRGDWNRFDYGSEGEGDGDSDEGHEADGGVDVDEDALAEAWLEELRAGERYATDVFT